MHRAAAPSAGVLAALVACAVMACGGTEPVARPRAPRPPRVVVAPSPSPECSVAARERGQVAGFYAEGKLDRIARVLERADAFCPAGAPETWGVLVETFAELGRRDDVEKLAATIDASPLASGAARAAAKRARAAVGGGRAASGEPAKPAILDLAAIAYGSGKLAEAKQGFLDAWTLDPRDGRALAWAGLATKAMGDRPAAQRAFDRALSELGRSSKRMVSLDVPAAGAAAMAWSRDGRVMALANGEAVSIRERAFGWRETMRLGAHDGPIGVVALSPDGHIVAWGTSQGAVGFWNLETGAEVRGGVEQRFAVRALTFSPDAKLVAVGSVEPVIHVLNASTGQESRRLLGHGGAVNGLAFSTNGETLFSGSDDRTVRAWDVGKGAVAQTFQEAAVVLALDVSPDGESIAVASGESVRLRRLPGGKSIRTLRARITPIASVAFSQDGKRIAAAGDAVHVWAAATGEELRTLGNEDSRAVAVAFSPDGDAVAAASPDRVRMWGVSSGAERRLDEDSTLPASVSALAVSPDGARLVVGSGEGALRIWNLAAGDAREIRAHQGAVESIAASSDGKLLASCSRDGTVRLWDIATGTQKRTLTGASPRSVALSPDGKTIAVGGGDSVVRLFGIDGGATASLLGHRAPVVAVAFSPDGKALASGSEDGTARVWNLATGARVHRFVHERSLTAVAYAPDGKTIATSSEDGTLQLWSAETGAGVRLVRTNATSVAFSPDGSTVVSGSPDRTTTVWSLDGRQLHVHGGHRGGVRAVTFLPDGKTVVAGCDEGTVYLWPTANHPLLLRGIPGRNAGVAFTDGAPQSIELVGPDTDAAGAHVTCQAGAYSFPFDVCRERLEVPHLLVGMLAGDPFNPYLAR